nr:hypothetical protein [uncultured Rhodopila sp.]
MNPIRATATMLGLAISLSGCTTWVDVTKVTPGSDAPGIRYSLPAPFLLVQPQADGSASYTWIYLPDSDATYAIQQHAFLAKFTLDVTLVNGLLGKVNAQSDDTAIAAKLLGAAQSVYAAKQQASGAQSKADAATLATARTAVNSARLALSQAQQESDAINAPNSGFSDAQKQAAQLKLIDAQAAFQAAQQTLGQILGAGAADLPAAPQQWGPILFRVQQDTAGGVSLVAVNTQDRFDTVTAATGSAAVASDYTLKLQTQPPLPSAPKPLVLSIAITPAIVSADAKTSFVERSDGSTVTVRPALTLSGDKKTLTVTFPNGLPKGSYNLSPAVVLQAGQQAVSKHQVAFTVDGN